MVATKEEQIQHGVELLRAISDDWEGGYLSVEIDPTCGFHTGTPGTRRCGAPLGKAFVLRARLPSRSRPSPGRTDGVHVLGLCNAHAEIMTTSVERWRAMA